MAWIDFIGHPIGLDGHPLGLDVWYYVYFCTMVSFVGMSALMSLFGQYSAFSIFHDAESGTNKFETRRCLQLPHIHDGLGLVPFPIGVGGLVSIATVYRLSLTTYHTGFLLESCYCM